MGLIPSRQLDAEGFEFMSRNASFRCIMRHSCAEEWVWTAEWASGCQWQTLMIARFQQIISWIVEHSIELWTPSLRESSLTKKKYQYGPIPVPPLPLLSSSLAPYPSIPLPPPPPNQLGDLGERCKLPQRGLGQSHKCMCDILSPENAFGGNKTGFCVWQSSERSGVFSSQPKKCRYAITGPWYHLTCITVLLNVPRSKRMFVVKRSSVVEYLAVHGWDARCQQDNSTPDTAEILLASSSHFFHVVNQLHILQFFPLICREL